MNLILSVVDKSTDASGFVRDTVSWWWVNFKTTREDSSYNDYRIRAVYDGDTTCSELTLAYNTVTEGDYVPDTLVLAATEEGSPNKPFKGWIKP